MLDDTSPKLTDLFSVLKIGLPIGVHSRGKRCCFDFALEAFSQQLPNWLRQLGDWKPFCAIINIAFDTEKYLNKAINYRKTLLSISGLSFMAWLVGSSRHDQHVGHECPDFDLSELTDRL